MRVRTPVTAALVAGTVAFAGLAVTAPVGAHTTGIHDNCTNFNEKYPHGVGRRGAHDQGGDVTSFKRSNKIYRIANSHNSDLDRDDDKIACEKA